jgi:hypothetical protein
MKISNRAKSALATAGYSVSESSAIAQLVGFAAQNSGIEFGNYGDRKAYAEECRGISKDWKRFKESLYVAHVEGVTDADVIATAPRAFSGRLEWKTIKTVWEGDAPNCTKKEVPTDGHWEYCTGQYFCVEYRKAAAAVMEEAARQVRLARPPQHRTVTTLGELKALNKANGGCWFEPAEMRFFGTRIESEIIRGKYFVTSEQREHDTPRKFSIRSFDDKGDIDTIGKFHSFNSKADAVAAIPQE